MSASLLRTPRRTLGRDLSPQELREFVRELAELPELWIEHVAHNCPNGSICAAIATAPIRATSVTRAGVGRNPNRVHQIVPDQPVAPRRSRAIVIA